MSRNLIARMLALTLTVFLAACGGDENSTPLVNTDKNSGGNNSENDNPGADLRAAPGHYETTVIASGEEDTAGNTILSESGRFVTFTEIGDITFGEIAFVDGEGVEGSGKTFFFDDSPSAHGTISGTIFSEGLMHLHFAAAPDYKSEASLERLDALSDAGINKDILAGVYYIDAPEPATQISITIEDDLSLAGDFGSGCGITGKAVIPDTAYNVFEASYTMNENCGTDETTSSGTFTGLGYLDNGKLLFFATDNVTVDYFIES